MRLEMSASAEIGPVKGELYATLRIISISYEATGEQVKYSYGKGARLWFKAISGRVAARYPWAGVVVRGSEFWVRFSGTSWRRADVGECRGEQVVDLAASLLVEFQVVGWVPRVQFRVAC